MRRNNYSIVKIVCHKLINYVCVCACAYMLMCVCACVYVCACVCLGEVWINFSTYTDSPVIWCNEFTETSVKKPLYISYEISFGRCNLGNLKERLLSNLSKWQVQK